MKTKDLIAMLERLIEHDKLNEEYMGESEIMIDMFDLDAEGLIKYRGFSKDVKITYSRDGVYAILTAWKADDIPSSH